MLTLHSPHADPITLTSGTYADAIARSDADTVVTHECDTERFDAEIIRAMIASSPADEPRCVAMVRERAEAYVDKRTARATLTKLSEWGDVYLALVAALCERLSAFSPSFALAIARQAASPTLRVALMNALSAWAEAGESDCEMSAEILAYIA